MTSKKDQHIKELQNLLAAEKVRSALLDKYAYRLRRALDEIIAVAEDSQ